MALASVSILGAATGRMIGATMPAGRGLWPPNVVVAMAGWCFRSKLSMAMVPRMAGLPIAKGFGLTRFESKASACCHGAVAR